MSYVIYETSSVGIIGVYLSAALGTSGQASDNWFDCFRTWDDPHHGKVYRIAINITLVLSK